MNANSIKNYALSSLSVALLLMGSTRPNNASAADASLDAPLEDVSAFIGNEVVALCRAQNRPCGVEQEQRPQVGRPKSTTMIHLKKTTFRKALDQTVRLHPGNRWTVRDGVVNFEPLNRIGPDMLSRKLDKVSIHGVPSDEAFNLVLKQAGIRTSGSAYSGAGPMFANVDVELKSITVRDALNAIAKADGQICWWFSADKPEQSLASFSASTWRKPPAR